MDKLKEMGKFLEMYNLPRANQEKIDNMKKLIPRNKIESLIKKEKKISQKTKVQDQVASQVNSIKHLEKH